MPDISLLDELDAELFEVIFEHSPDALFISTDEDDTVVVACNNRAVTLYEVPNKSYLLGKPTYQFRFSPPTHADLVHRTHTLAEKGMVRTEVQYRTFSGKAFWGAHLVKRIPFGQGSMRLTRITDITEQKQLEEKLRHTNTVLADAESITHLGTWEFDLVRNEIYWSDETFRLYGIEPHHNHILLENFWQFIHPNDVERLRKAVELARTNGTTYHMELRGLQPDGSYHFHEARGKAVRDEDGNIVKIIGTVRNINADKRREAELLYHKEQLENIVNNITEVVVKMSVTGIITFVSQNWTILTGTPIEEAVGRSFVDFIHPDDIAGLYQILIASMNLPHRTHQNNIEYRVWHSQLEEWRWHSANASMMDDVGAGLQYILATVRDVSDEKRVAERLRRSEEFLTEAQQMANMGSWYTNLKTNMTEWSEEMYRIYNLPRTRTPYNGEEFVDIVHPKDKFAVQEKLSDAVQMKLQGQMEFRIVREDGTIIWLDARVKPVLHPQTERVIALFGIVWDITSRKTTEEEVRLFNIRLEERVQERTREIEQTNVILRAQIEERIRAEEALQRSQQNLRTLIESTNDLIWSIDRHYRFTTINASCYSVLRIENGATIDVGDSSLTETLGIKTSTWLEYYNRVLQSERFSVYSQYKLTGYTFDVEISFSPIISTSNSVIGAVMFARDISERLLAERELREREALLNLILETVATGVALTSSNGIIVRVNRAFASILEYTQEELVGRHFSITIPENRRTLGDVTFQKMLRERTKLNSVEIQLVSKQGNLVDVEVAQTVIVNESNEVFVVASVNNITERKNAEAEIRRALEQERELSAMQSRFVVMVSHEFRTPLTTIRASAQLLERNRGKWTAEKQQSYFEDIDDSVNAMTELLEDVLSWGKGIAKRVPFEPKPTKIGELLDSILDGFRVVEIHNNRIDACLPDPETLSKVAVIDGKLIRQILTNLLSNALKYSPLETKVIFEAEIDMKSISFHIRDNGIGISEDDQKHLFEPFYRATNVGNIAGTGLGLAIVRQAVELHGGTIHLTSVRGEGTEFIVVIPCTFA
jgi:PAS domain S-box-containing protein